MIKRSSNSDATAVFNKVGVERLKEILQDERYGKLYDPDRGGGLWCGKSYAKGSAVQRDPLHKLSHGASAIQAARFYYGYLNGTILDHKYLPLLKEMFGSPGIKHKFVKGLEGRDVDIYRKSGTWSNYHADSGIFVREDLTYIVAYIRQNLSTAGSNVVTGIRLVDDLMLERAARRKSE